MDIEQITKKLKHEWDRDAGFLGGLRIGVVDEDAFVRFLALLEQLPKDMPVLDRKLVTILWDIPLFMEWQTHRISECGCSAFRYAQIKSEVHEELQRILNASWGWS